ncbi:MAG: hypothetical protein Q8R82_07085 [Hyphomonadaceae bacterium]|nr:hypothetical protein [Hyphomonadaceae bacterium]
MSGIVFKFFSLGGVILEQFCDPDAPGGVALLPARVFLADPRESRDGLVAEMARRLPAERRIPWIDHEARDLAARTLGADNLVADADAYIRSTPAYEGSSDLYRGDDS